VAFELQIGLEAEVSSLCQDHLAYEEGQILKAQPLLRKYKESQEKNNGVNTNTTFVSSSLMNKSEDHDDFKLISSVIESNFDNYRYQALGKEKIDGKGMTPIVPDRLCLNNKRLNIWANQGKAVILDGPFKLNPSQRYLVDSMSLKMDEHIWGISVGLFTYFGPYMLQILALFLSEYHKKEIFLIKPGINFLTMESIPLLPPRCNGIILVAWGYITSTEGCGWKWAELKDYYHGMKLVLNQYEELAE
jgi:hypothetical protein